MLVSSQAQMKFGARKNTKPKKHKTNLLVLVFGVSAHAIAKRLASCVHLIVLARVVLFCFSSLWHDDLRHFFVEKASDCNESAQEILKFVTKKTHSWPGRVGSMATSKYGSFMVGDSTRVFVILARKTTGNHGVYVNEYSFA